MSKRTEQHAQTALHTLAAEARANGQPFAAHVAPAAKPVSSEVLEQSLTSDPPAVDLTDPEAPNDDAPEQPDTLADTGHSAAEPSAETEASQEPADADAADAAAPDAAVADQE